MMKSITDLTDRAGNIFSITGNNAYIVTLVLNWSNVYPLQRPVSQKPFFFRLGGKDISDLDKKPMPQPSYRQTNNETKTSKEADNSDTSTTTAAN